MAITLPTGKIHFKTGTIAQYNALSVAQKNASTLFLINNSDKLYLYSGPNPIYSKIETTDTIASNNYKPVTSSAVYNYINNDANKVLIYAGAGITPEVYGTASMLKGKFYYFDDGTIKFQYGLGTTPITIQPKLTIDSAYNKNGTNPINGIGVSKGLKTIFEVVAELPAKGTAGITEKIYCVTKDSKSDLYFFPTLNSEAVKINLDANSLTGIIVTDPVGDSQTINKTLKLIGDVQIAPSKILNVDVIKKSSTTADSKIQIQDNVLFTQNIVVNKNATFNENAEIKDTLTANMGIINSNLTVSGQLTNTNVFSTVQKTSNVTAKVILNDAAEFYFGNSSGYYLKPNSINLPGGAITGNLNLGSSSGNSHTIQGSVTFNSGTIYFSNSNAVSNASFTNPALIIGANGSSAEHLEIGRNELQAKAEGLQNTILSLNPYGGQVSIGSGGLSCAGTAIFNSTATIAGDLTFKNKALTSIAEGKSEDSSGSAVNGVNTRLVYAEQQLLTKADITDSTGLIKMEIDNLNTNLSDTISTNKTALDDLIVIEAASSTYTGPTSENTKIWIDTSQGTESTKGVLKIKNSAGTWVPIASVWGN